MSFQLQPAHFPKEYAAAIVETQVLSVTNNWYCKKSPVATVLYNRFENDPRSDKSLTHGFRHLGS